MKSFHRIILAALLTGSAMAADTASQIAAKLSELQNDGSSYVRLKLEVQAAGGAKSSMQLQIKQRRSAGSTELLYQVLWPKEAAGEGVLLRRSGAQASGTVFTLPDKSRNLGASQMKEPLFGSALTYGDVLENFFAWKNQQLVGKESVDRIECEILESRPGAGDFSTAPVVKSWIDTRRMVPLRVEKYDSAGKAVCRIDTLQVVRDDKGRNIPAHLSITNLKTGIGTQLDGSKLKHGVTYAGEEFTAAGLRTMTVPK